MAKKATTKKSVAKTKKTQGQAVKVVKTAKAVKAPPKPASKAPAKAAKPAVAKVVKAAKSAKASGVSDPAAGIKLKKTYLSKAELKDFREMLVAKRRTLVGDLYGIEAEALRRNRQDGTGDLSNMPTHPADVGTDNYEQEFSLGLLESERQLLKEIDQALERIDNGTYGICQGTGQPIAKARLVARPWSKYGIEYARMIEKGLVRPEDEEDRGEDDEDLVEDADEEAEGEEDAEETPEYGEPEEATVEDDEV